MIALLTAALIALIGLAAMGVLADSGLRWWSAFGRLRRELAIGAQTTLPIARVSVSCSSFGRSQLRRPIPYQVFSRAAA